MRHTYCAFFYIIMSLVFSLKTAKAELTLKHESFLTNTYYLGESAQVRLDNFVSLSNSNLQKNQDLFLSLESIREFEFNSIYSKWNLGSRYSDLEGLQIWVRELNTQYQIDLPNLETKIGFRAGRFYHTNLKMDSIWGLGVVEPQFRGDPLVPIHQGLTGLSVWTDLGDVQFSLFASPINFPDTGISYNIQNGEVVSNSPWFTPTPTSVVYQGQDIRLNYNLDINNIMDLLLAPSVVAGVKTEVYGLNVAMYGGLLPSNQFFLEVDPKARLNDRDEVIVEAHVLPRLLPKTFFAMKLDKTVDKTNFWGEIYTENHRDTQKNAIPDFYQSEIYNHSYVALGMDTKFHIENLDLKVGASWLKNMSQIKLNSLNEFQFGNYIFHNAFETRLALQIHPSRFDLSFNFKYDLDESAFLASPRITYKTKDNIQIYSQYDLLGRSKSMDFNGFLAQQAANDRFTVGLNYVF